MPTTKIIPAHFLVSGTGTEVYTQAPALIDQELNRIAEDFGEEAKNEIAMFLHPRLAGFLQALVDPIDGNDISGEVSVHVVIDEEGGAVCSFEMTFPPTEARKKACENGVDYDHGDEEDAPNDNG